MSAAPIPAWRPKARFVWPVLLAIAAASTGVTSYLAVSSGDRADHLEARSIAGEQKVRELQALLRGPGSGVAGERARLAARGTVLSAVAREYEACRSGLTQLLGYVLDDNYDSATSVMDDVRATCASAESDLAGYEATYGP